VIEGIAKGCQMAKAALIGGETAEMPGMYATDDYDLAGFTVGIVEKDAVIDGSSINPGDVLIALASSGPHSNGYSLIRHIINHNKANISEPFGNATLADALLTPTRIYVQSLLALAKEGLLKGAAHITGGGFIDNIPRILPKHCAAWIDCQSWELPPIFQWLQKMGNLSAFELRRTFNCGVGMVVCVNANNVESSLALLREHNETAWILGEIKQRAEHEVLFSDET
ncbi:MAG TPA: phosphoribosylformylglycinamidine cyclo-ligase, partial [Candidatus Berkiella sp.]|nr:phosphoribosylformylglycinamidine cyclo-ligase [Candidatus Berkiella sp.]